MITLTFPHGAGWKLPWPGTRAVARFVGDFFGIGVFAFVLVWLSWSYVLLRGEMAENTAQVMEARRQVEGINQTLRESQQTHSEVVNHTAQIDSILVKLDSVIAKLDAMERRPAK